VYDTEYKLPADAFVINRYGQMLAGEVSLLVARSDGRNCKYGSMTVLPFIAELEQKEAMNLILEDLIGKPQQSLPPDWVDQIPMPFVDAINAEIGQKNAVIESLRQEIAARAQKLAEIEKWKKLVYTTGRELEQIFEEAVIKLGAKTKPAAAEEEFIFEHKGNAGVVECKGVGKSISLEHVRQTDSHVLKFITGENPNGKGVLLGNAWRNIPLSERGGIDTPMFPDNVVKHAAQREIALVGADDFLEVFCRFLKGPRCYEYAERHRRFPEDQVITDICEPYAAEATLVAASGCRSAWSSSGSSGVLPARVTRSIQSLGISCLTFWSEGQNGSS
jgi:hypothetical protein